MAMITNIYSCPCCHASGVEKAADAMACPDCGAEFPILLGQIVDFRIVGKDLTANFSFKQDSQIASLLMQAFPRFRTFNELNALYQSLKIRQKSGVDVSGMDLNLLLREVKPEPEPMKPDQCVHGRAILEKIDGFLAELGVNLSKTDIALENGCGLGLFIDGLAAHFKQLYVLDLSLCYLVLASKIIEERGIKNTQLICGSVENLPIRSGTIMACSTYSRPTDSPYGRNHTLLCRLTDSFQSRSGEILFAALSYGQSMMFHYAR
jgi:hypothetical protein